MKKRFKIIGIIIILSFTFVIYKLAIIQLKDKPKYTEYVFESSHNFWYGTSTPRGKIYDRNGNIIVDNEGIKQVYYIKSPKNTTKNEIKLAYNLANILDIDYTTLSKYNLKKFYLLTKGYINNYKDKIENITDKELEILNEKDKKAAYIYYLMNIGYSYAPKTIKKEITDEEYTRIISANLENIKINYDWKRKYNYSSLKSILGNISSIPYENKNYYLQNGYNLDDKVGISYIEKSYENILKGKKNKYEIKNGNMILIETGNKGNDIYLTIDINIQEYLEKLLEEELIKTKKEYNTKYFNKIFVVVLEPNTGDVLALSGKQIVKVGNSYKVYDYAPGTFLNAYTSGSVIKGASHIVGYNTNSLKIGEKRNDTCLKIGNISKCSWTYLGYINDIDALKMSSNTYQFRTAINVGKGKYTYGKALSIDKNAFNIYRKVFNDFGLGTKTGIDLENESIGYVGTSTLPGLLLDLSIGQYDTYTPLQLAQYISSLATGKRMKVRLVNKISENKDIKIIDEVELNKIETEKKYLDRVKLGFKEVVSSGLGYGYMYYKGAGKTGTAESFIDSDNDGIIDAPTITKTFVGYFPYDEPKYAYSIVAPDISYASGYESNITQRISYNLTKKIYEMYLKNT